MAPFPGPKRAGHSLYDTGANLVVLEPYEITQRKGFGVLFPVSQYGLNLLVGCISLSDRPNISLRSVTRQTLVGIFKLLERP